MDTTGGSGAWTATWFAKLAADNDYTQIRSTQQLLDEDINAVGIPRSNRGFSADITRFSLISESLTPPPGIPGDTDGDGDVDDSDLGTAFSNFTGPMGAAGGKTAADGDTDGDGDVDDSDLANAFVYFTGPVGLKAVPEPAGLAALVAGLFVVGRRRR